MIRHFVTAAAALAAFSTPAFAVNLDFEDLVAGTSYIVGDSFTTGGIDVDAQGFTWTGGTLFTGGSATVNNTGFAGGSGLDMGLNNILLDFALGAVENLTLSFGEFGGNLNLSVNGDFRNFDNFVDLSGATIGGALMTVAAGTGLGNDQGSFLLTGATITQFSIGGQELWIDDLMAEVTDVPLPASVLLLGAGLAGMGAFKRRKT